ncbi:MAG: hypothetical protein JOZ69_17075 [Myxococcales bacterium]|nr:hypothetical protein [Myxococcales bacterium]
MHTWESIGAFLLLALFSVHCGGGGSGQQAARPAESPSPTSAQRPDDPNRALSRPECESLAGVIVDACNNRGNDRSAELDGWCSDMVRRNAEGGTWVEDDCAKHVKYMDYFCFQAAKNAHAMLDCDRTVDRSK